MNTVIIVVGVTIFAVVADVVYYISNTAQLVAVDGGGIASDRGMGSPSNVTSS